MRDPCVRGWIYGHINLRDTLMCGQAFRWREHEDLSECRFRAKPSIRMDGVYYGVVRGRVARLRVMRNGKIHFEGSGKFDYRRYFGLDDDLGEIYRRLSKDNHMARIIQMYHGMRILRQEPFETLISYIISAASSIPRISETVERVSKKYGEKIEFKGRTFYSFPTPEQLEKAGIPELRGMGLGFRAPYVHGVVKAILKGEIELDELKHQSYPEAKKALMALDGVGDKVADCVLLFSLDKLSAFPVDRWVRRVTGELYFNGGNPTPKRIREWAAEYFGEYAGYAQQYLFHYWRRLKGRTLKGRG